MVTPWVRGSVLEVGCGWTSLAPELPEGVTALTGCDRSGETVEDLKRTYPDHHFFQVDLDHEDFPAGIGPFQTVLATAVIEHLFNLEAVMQRLTSLLSPDGRVVMTTPTPFGNDFVFPVTSLLGLTSQAAHDDHINILNRRRFGILAREVGLELREYRRFQLGCNSLAVLEWAAGGRDPEAGSAGR